eukprot:EG_transcript_2428
MVLSALQFSVQSIFSLHFLSMCGMGFDVPWGFDIGLTLVSLTLVLLFGTSAIAYALILRQRLEPQMLGHFGQELRSPCLSLYPKLLRFILSHVPFCQLLLAVTLMVVGAAGCHHVGMWSIHGMAGERLTSQLNLWSSLTTIGVGGTACVVIILAFLLVPEGPAAILTTLVLTAGITAFHATSAIWGMQYLVGEEGVTTSIVMGEEAVIMFVVAQGAVSQIITAVFSRMAVQHEIMMMKQLQVAETLGNYIAEMDLGPAKAMQLEADNPSCLEQTLFHIVDNLLLYRPYLPDTLFANHQQEDDNVFGTQKEDTDEDGNTPRSITSQTSRFRTRSSVHTLSRAVRRMSTLFNPRVLAAPQLSDSETVEGDAVSTKGSHMSSVIFNHTKVPTPKSKGGKNLALGLRAARLTVLRTRLQDIGLGWGVEEVEEHLSAFIGTVTAEVKAHGGVIVTCSGGFLVALWYNISPDVALDTAIAIQHQSKQDLTQVVQTGPFLSGNLATEHLRCFNVAGPLQWAGHLLMRVGNGRCHIFITSAEWERVRFRYPCLPYEHVLVDGAPTTLYTVLPTPPASPEAALASEWMYELEGKLQEMPFEEVQRCWQAYTQGNYLEARTVALSLCGVPAWYAEHLLAIVEDAAASRVKLPIKSLEALGWVPIPRAPSLAGLAVVKRRSTVFRQDP